MFKLLGIGNSFSDDAFEFVYPMINALKINDAAISNLYIGGCSLDTHLYNMQGDLPNYEFRRFEKSISSANFKISEALKIEDWQYITLQQASNLSGRRDSFARLRQLLDLLNESKPQNAKIFWHMTWAYANHYKNTGFNQYRNDQITMYNAIVDCVKNEISKYDEFVGIIPSGTAIQNARSSSLGDTLDRDGLHLSYDLGRYIASLCVVCKLLDVTPETIDFVPKEIDRKRKQIAIESVKNALKILLK